MPDRWDEFIHNQNVARYRRMLGETTDEQTRKMLMRLLEEEVASATAHRWPPTETDPSPPAPPEPDPAPAVR